MTLLMRSDRGREAPATGDQSSHFAGSVRPNPARQCWTKFAPASVQPGKAQTYGWTRVAMDMSTDGRDCGCGWMLPHVRLHLRTA